MSIDLEVIGSALLFTVYDGRTNSSNVQAITLSQTTSERKERYAQSHNPIVSCNSYTITAVHLHYGHYQWLIISILKKNR